METINRYFGKIDLMVRSAMPRLLASAASLAVLAGIGSAKTETWSGGDRNDPNWTSNGNWSGLGGASRNDTLIFPAGAARLANLNDFPINTSFDFFDFRGPGYTITGNQIFLEKGMIVRNTSNGAQTNLNLNMVLGADQTWEGLSNSFSYNGVVHLNGYTLFLETHSSVGLTMTGLINGTGKIIKLGPGGATIAGDGDGFGSTNINDGSVTVTGNLGDVLLVGGTLRGTGSINGSVQSTGALKGGAISPGSSLNGSTGILSVNGLVSLDPGVNVVIDVNGPQASDQLRVTGSSVNLTGANLVLNLGFTPTVGQQFTIVSQIGTGNINGQFNQGTGIVDNGQLFTITYTPSSVVLTALGPVVP